MSRLSGPALAPVGGALLTALVLALLSWRLLPLGVPGQWEWPWRAQTLLPGAGTLLALILYALAAWLVGRALVASQAITRPRAGIAVALCVLATASLLVALPLDSPEGPVVLTASTVSLTTMAYYSEVLLHPSLATALRQYVADSARPTRFPRVRTHPPGPLVTFWVGRRILEAWPAPTVWVLSTLATTRGLTAADLYSFSRYYAVPAVTVQDMAPALLLGMVVTLGGALLPWAAYVLGMGLAGRREGLAAALLAAGIPSLLAFNPSIEGVAAVLGLLAVGLWAQALRRGQGWLYALAAGVMVLALLWTAGLVVLLLPLAVMLASVLVRPSSELPEGCLSPLRGTLLALGVAAGLLLGLWLVTGYSFPANFLVINQAQRDIMAEWQRDYWVWLPMNLYDVLLFMGPVLVVLSGAGLRLLRSGGGMGLALVAGSMAMLLIVLLTGTTLGEVGRIWLFMMPLLSWPAAVWLGRQPHSETGLAIALATGCQFIYAISLYNNLSLVHP